MRTLRFTVYGQDVLCMLIPAKSFISARECSRDIIGDYIDSNNKELGREMQTVYYTRVYYMEGDRSNVVDVVDSVAEIEDEIRMVAEYDE